MKLDRSQSSSESNVESFSDGWSVTQPAWSRAALFYAIEENTVVLFSHLEKQLSKLKKKTPDFEARDHFRKFGYTPPSKTFWREIRKVPFYAQLRWSSLAGLQLDEKRPVRSAPSDEITTVWVEEFLHIFSQAAQQALSRSNGWMALSGGLDSRAVLTVLSPQDRKQLRAYTKVHPRLKLDEDADATAATLVAQRLEVPHHLMLQPQSYTIYLDPEVETRHPRVLSGLYGGELLGGTLWDLLEGFEPSAFEDKLEALLGSAQALFYNFTRFSWASPYTLTDYTESPFRDPSVIEKILSLHPECYTDYRAYEKVYQHPLFAEVRQVPIQSELTRYYPFPVPDGGTNPKVLQSVITEGGWGRPASIEELAQNSIDYFDALVAKP